MRIILLGNNRLADEVEDLAKYLGHEVVGRLTTDTIGMIQCIPHEGLVMAAALPSTKEVFLEASKRYYCKWTSLVSPHARVGMGAKLHNGCVIMHGAAISPYAVIESHTYIGCNSTVGHKSRIGECCTIENGVNIAQDIWLGNGKLIDTGLRIAESF
jgi:UDP-3-O-[3-hydroxymyristoyl] glucosamine N-acyltransferase